VAEATANPFSPRIVAGVVVAGVIAFLGFLFLTAYAPQMAERGDGGVHPLSRSLVGFYGLYRLAETTGRPVDLGRTKDSWQVPGLVIVTISPETDPARLKSLVDARRNTDRATTLYILPKWISYPMPDKYGWVLTPEMLPPRWSPKLLNVFGPIAFNSGTSARDVRISGVGDNGLPNVDVAAPRRLHYIVSGMDPVLADTAGRTIMGAAYFENGSEEYILADPDLLSNRGLKSAEGARAALSIIDDLRADEQDSVAFDLALNARDDRNLLQLMFEPPFLAVTLAVLVAAALTAIGAFGRFGPPLTEPRAIPFGKRALADNAAVLIGRAGAVKRLGDRYVAHIREAVAGALGAGTLDAVAQERWLTELPGIAGPDFATLAARARGADSSEAMRAAAAALHHWRGEVMRDR